MTDMWISPVDRARMPNDILTRIDNLEGQSANSQSFNVAAQTMSELTSDVGSPSVANVNMGTGDPLDTTTNPTGVFMAAPGIPANSDTYNLAGLLNGVLQMGMRNSDGAFVAGGGAVVLDQNGVHIYNGATEVARMGNLNGFLSYVAAVYGLGIGSANNYLTYDPSGGLKIKGTLGVFQVTTGGFDVWDEPVSGTPNGVIKYFSTNSGFVAGTLQIISNGLWLQENVDYTEGHADRIYAYAPPQTGDVLLINYIKSSDLSAVYNETPTGAINGINTIYTSANTHIPGSVQFSVNGVIQDSSNDYRDGLRAIVMSSSAIVQSGDLLTSAYLVVSNSKFIFQESITGLVNGINTVYTFANNYASGTPIVVLNGVKQSITSDYTESAANQITMVAPPQIGDILWSSYLKP